MPPQIIFSMKYSSTCANYAFIEQGLKVSRGSKASGDGGWNLSTASASCSWDQQNSRKAKKGGQEIDGQDGGHTRSCIVYLIESANLV